MRNLVRLVVGSTFPMLSVMPSAALKELWKPLAVQQTK
jgi:hypothetical protein